MIEAYRADVLKFIGQSAMAAARKHACEVFPNESCGFIADGVYVACENKHPTPTDHFLIDDPRYEAALTAGKITSIIHSHPYGPIYPSQLDMEQQIATDVPWVIITLNEKGVAHEVAWGGNLPIAPVISRPFVHGVLDCFSMIRDVYRLGHDELLKQGVHWPFAPIELAEVPRSDAWWKTEEDLYMANFGSRGFREITRAEARPGDVFLMRLGDRQANPNKRINHGGVLLEYDQILHHLPVSISARCPAGLWARAADLWLRYEGVPQ